MSFRLPKKYYFIFEVATLVLINFGAYLKYSNVFEMTPVFGTTEGLISTVILYSISIFCSYKLFQKNWFVSAILGAIITTVSFTIAFNLTTSFSDSTPSREQVFPFWTYISLLYTCCGLIALVLMPIIFQSKD